MHAFSVLLFVSSLVAVGDIAASGSSFKSLPRPRHGIASKIINSN
jgi:hypothetical protein